MRTIIHAVLAPVLVAVSLVAGVVGALPSPAVQAVPGVPNAPVLILREDTESAPETGSPQSLSDYIADIGGRYTASAYRNSAGFCNSFIISTMNTRAPGLCQSDVSGLPSPRDLAYALGTINGSANALTPASSPSARTSPAPPPKPPVKPTSTPARLPTPRPPAGEPVSSEPSTAKNDATDVSGTSIQLPSVFLLALCSGALGTAFAFRSREEAD